MLRLSHQTAENTSLQNKKTALVLTGTVV